MVQVRCAIQITNAFASQAGSVFLYGHAVVQLVLILIALLLVQQHPAPAKLARCVIQITNAFASQAEFVFLFGPAEAQQVLIKNAEPLVLLHRLPAHPVKLVLWGLVFLVIVSLEHVSLYFRAEAIQDIMDAAFVLRYLIFVLLVTHAPLINVFLPMLVHRHLAAVPLINIVPIVPAPLVHKVHVYLKI